MSNVENDNKLLHDALKHLYGKEVDVKVTINNGLTFYGEMFLGLDSRFKPPHRLNIHDSKGNTLLIQLDKDRLNVFFHGSSDVRIMKDENWCDEGTHVGVPTHFTNPDGTPVIHCTICGKQLHSSEQSASGEDV